MTAKIYRDLFRKRIPAPKESTFQIDLVTMLRWCLRPDVLFWHTPTGEHRDIRTAQKLKAMGTLAGVADLQFHWSEWDMRVLRDITSSATVVGKVRKVMHMELKVGKRPQSLAQVDFALAMRLLGDEYHIARSIDEAIEILGTRGLLRSDIEICGRRW